MSAKVLLLCLFAVVILHCGVAEVGKGKDSSTWTWKSIQKIIDALPKKILIGCGEHVVYGAVSRICTDFESARCQSVTDNIWKAYNYFGLATGTFSGLQTFCTMIGGWIIQGVEVAAEIGWYGLTTSVGLLAYYSGYAPSNRPLLE